MNTLFSMQPQEQTLRQERLHAGIFGLPVLTFILLLLPATAFIFLLNAMNTIFAQLSPQGPRFPFATILLLLFLMDLLPALLFFLVVLAAFRGCHITLTNQRLIYRTGFLVRAAGELPLENVEGIFLIEPLLGRFLGYGTVAVSSLGGRTLTTPPLCSDNIAFTRAAIRMGFQNVLKRN